MCIRDSSDCRELLPISKDWENWKCKWFGRVLMWLGLWALVVGCVVVLYCIKYCIVTLSHIKYLRTSAVLTKCGALPVFLHLNVRTLANSTNSTFRMTKDIWFMCVSYWKNASKLYSDGYRTEAANHIGSRWRHQFYFFNNSRRNEIQMLQITLLSSFNSVFKWIRLMQRERSLTTHVHQMVLQQLLFLHEVTITSIPNVRTP